MANECLVEARIELSFTVCVDAFPVKILEHLEIFAKSVMSRPCLTPTKSETVNSTTLNSNTRSKNALIYPNAKDEFNHQQQWKAFFTGERYEACREEERFIWWNSTKGSFVCFFFIQTYFSQVVCKIICTFFWQYRS